MGSISARPEPSLVRHVDGLYESLDDLFAAGEAVEQLLAHPGWAHITRLIEAEIATIEAKADGQLLDSRAEYAFAHGRRGGLQGAVSAAAAIVGRAALKHDQQRAKHEDTAESVSERS